MTSDLTGDVLFRPSDPLFGNLLSLTLLSLTLLSLTLLSLTLLRLRQLLLLSIHLVTTKSSHRSIRKVKHKTQEAQTRSKIESINIMKEKNLLTSLSRRFV